MPKLENMIGKKYGRLTIVSQAEGNFKTRGRRWMCECECGNIVGPISTSSFNWGSTHSCGCLNAERTAKRATIHGLSGTKFYQLWFRIKQRCYSKNRHNYERYGGRGIYMYDGWIDDPESFIKYVEALENSDDDTRTLDRIDNEEGYIPGNLRFATIMEQATNKRSTKLNWDLVREIREKYKTGDYTQTALAKELGLSHHLVHCVVNNKTWKETNEVIDNNS